MPLFGSIDNAANTPAALAVGQLNIPLTANNKAGLYQNTTGNVVVQRATVGIYGVGADEMRAARANGSAKPAHAGWVLKREGQGGRAGRITYETLVAGGSISGDGEDTSFPDYKLLIGTQPSNSSIGTANAVNFTVAAASVPPGASIRYQWQQDGGPGVLVWSNVANSGVFASANGNTSATLSISNNATLNLNNFSVLVSTNDAVAIRSSNARLYITG